MAPHTRHRSLARHAALFGALLISCSTGTELPGAVNSTATDPGYARRDGEYVLPADRATRWQPGVTYNGGIPSDAWPVHATLAPSGSDDVAAIQHAIAAAHAAHPDGVVVALTAGTFDFNGGFVLVPSHTVLRGAGAGKTVLSVTNGAQLNSYFPGAHRAPLIVVGAARWSNGLAGSSDLTADGDKGSYSVTLASTDGFAAGDLVLLDEVSGAQWMPDPQGRGQVWAAPDWRVVYQLHDPPQSTDDPLKLPASAANQDAFSWFFRTDRPTAEVKQISSVDAHSVTFTTPIHIDYRRSHGAQLSKYKGDPVTNAGVESLTLRGGDDGNLRFEVASRCWARNVESTGWLGEAVAIESSFGVEVRDSYLHDTVWAQPGGGGYGVSLAGGSSEALIENNIIVMANKVMVARAAGAGSVIGYNYVDDGYIASNPRWIETGLNASHMVGSHHVLFEGNDGFNWDSDDTHGNSIYMTVFRNQLRGVRKAFLDPVDSVTYQDGTDAGPRRCIGAMAYSYWMSFVGNVLGVPGEMSGWAYESNSGRSTMGTPSVWLLGWDAWTPYPSDTGVAATALRDGNFDHQSESQRWHGIGDGASAPRALPPSLYMPAKPAFFGSLRWPSVDPSTGRTYALPARARFDEGRPNG